MICSWRSSMFSLLLTAAVFIASSIQEECTNDGKDATIDNCENSTTIVNTYLDQAINDTLRNLATYGHNTIRVRDLNGQISIDGIFSPVNCHLSLAKGYVIDPSTLKRKGDVYLSRTASKFTLTGAYTFDNLKIEYKNYSLSCFMNDMKGTITANLKGLTIEIQISAIFSHSECQITPDYVRIPELDNLNVTLTGLTGLNEMVSQFATTLARTWKKEIVKTLEGVLMDALTEGAEEFCNQNKDDIIATIYEINPEAHID